MNIKLLAMFKIKKKAKILEVTQKIEWSQMRGIKQFSLDFSIRVKANRHYKEKNSD